METVINIKPLKTQFSGKGEVLGYMFTQLEKGSNSYLYEVRNEDNDDIHYEVFKKKINTQYDCISYPRSKSFGIWAWTKMSLADALELFNNLNDIVI